MLPVKNFRTGKKNMVYYIMKKNLLRGAMQWTIVCFWKKPSHIGRNSA